MKTQRPLHVMMLGLRGFPNVQGGVETHAEHLCPRLARMGCEVTVVVRAPYQPKDIGPEWQGVKFVSLWAPKSKGLEAIVHTFLGTLYAAVTRPDILHIQAIGPAIMTLPARLLGLRVVVTHHGPDYDRQKWGHFARFVLQLGERWGMRCSNARIVISRVIADLVRAKHAREAALIPNGVVLGALPESVAALERFGLQRRRYVLLVSRLVPEKRHLDLIGAFGQARLPGWKLVIVGGADHPDEYQKSVIARAQETGTVMTGFQSGIALQELYAHAGLFVLPSSHEGMPIAMLEALSYGLPVIASGIPANVEVGLGEDHYFPLGDCVRLADRLRQHAARGADEASCAARRTWVAERNDWQRVAARTLEVYGTVSSNVRG